MKLKFNAIAALICLLGTIAAFAITPDSQIKWILFALFVFFALNTTLKR